MAGFIQNTKKSSFDRVSTATAFVSGAMRLKVQQDFLDKSQAVVISSMKTVDRQFVKEFEELYTDLERKRLQHLEKLHQSLMLIMPSLRELKVAVSNDDQLKSLDVDRYRQDLLELENKISTSKDSNEKEILKLAFQENALWDHVETVAQKIDEWSIPVKVSSFRPHSQSWSRPGSSYMGNARSVEVMDFQNFLNSSGGYTGGWDEDDHLLFLRLRRKYTDRNEFLGALQQEMPDKKFEDILNHEEWLISFDILKARQKKAIEEWRARRSKTKTSQVLDDEDLFLLERVKPSCANKSKTFLDKDSVDKKQKVEDWKKQKEEQKDLEEVRKLEEKKKSLSDWEKRKAKQEMQKTQVERYKAEKFNHEQALRVQKQQLEMEEMEKRAALANKALKAFREQDQEFINRMKNRRARRLSEQEDRLQLPLPKPKIVAERDPNRLLKLTRVWQERLQKLNEEVSPSFGKPVLHLRNIPHLGVPKWRKGLA
ncbi:coiled-coil domain-containing protein 112 [Anabrus simplex]|uniref:coiled-coil domain-containing protein 112 n=1 Tax=Anabrus simplex TaxID=316456 RepID=UPI0035A2A15B